MRQEWEEWEKHYAGTYVSLQNGAGLTTSVYVKGLIDRGREDIPPKWYVVKDSLEVALDAREWFPSPLPASCIFPMNNSVYVYYWLPERQWKRGLTRDNAVIFEPLQKYIREYNNTLFPDSPSFGETAIALLKTVHIKETTTAAISTLVAIPSLLGSALTDKYWISPHPAKKGFLLWRMEIPLAHIEYDPFTTRQKVEVLETFNKQEVEDLYRREGTYNAAIR
jgi:hypothetical protein